VDAAGVDSRHFKVRMQLKFISKEFARDLGKLIPILTIRRRSNDRNEPYIYIQNQVKKNTLKNCKNLQKKTIIYHHYISI
jgi:hypothetical protein